MYDRNFFIQKLEVENIEQPRNLFFKELMKKQKVLHVGCVDWPLFDEKDNLHLDLARTGQLKILDGCDVDSEGIENLKKYYPQGEYFLGLDKVLGKYDWVLVPEVIEHVPNIGEFCQNLGKLKAKHILITAPNVEGCNAAGFFGDTYPNYVEEVHPDHNVWFSPYTLLNVVKKYTGMNVEKVFVINERRSVGVILSRDNFFKKIKNISKEKQKKIAK